MSRCATMRTTARSLPTAQRDLARTAKRKRRGIESTEVSRPSFRHNGAQYHLPFANPAEGDQAHQRDDESQPEAPHDHQNDADDDEDATKTDTARVAACTTFCHRTASSTIASPHCALVHVGI